MTIKVECKLNKAILRVSPWFYGDSPTDSVPGDSPTDSVPTDRGYLSNIDWTIPRDFIQPDELEEVGEEFNALIRIDGLGWVGVMNIDFEIYEVDK